MPKALPPSQKSKAGAASKTLEIAAGRTSSTGMLIANSRKIRTASARPIASVGRPLDLSSNHTCARVADERGHGNRNRLTTHSGYPPVLVSPGTVATASPRRCRATPMIVSTIETIAIAHIAAYSPGENATSFGDGATSLSRKKVGNVMTIDPIHWMTLLRVDHWMQA